MPEWVSNRDSGDEQPPPYRLPGPERRAAASLVPCACLACPASVPPGVAFGLCLGCLKAGCVPHQGARCRKAG